MVRMGGRFLTITVLTALLWSSARAADDGAAPMLRIPGLPPIAMPPGTHVFGPDGDAADGSAARPGTPADDLYHEFGTVTPGGGRRAGEGERGRTLGGRAGADMFGGTVIGPGGVIPPAGTTKPATPRAPPPTPAERQARIRKALTPKPPFATARAHTLDDLYGKLAGAQDADEAKGLASLIAAVWMRSGSDTADLLCARADKAVADKKFALAIAVLDSVVALQPGWAEAWNKRASARYLAGDLNGAMSDVERVLKLDPRHFAALGGMAMILQQTGFPKRALQVYRRELSVYPHQPEVEKLVQRLSQDVEGQGI